MCKSFKETGVDAGVQAVETFGTFLFPRSVHLSGFIEETGRCTERGKFVFVSTACTLFPKLDRESEVDAYLMPSINTQDLDEEEIIWSRDETQIYRESSGAINLAEKDQ